MKITISLVQLRHPMTDKVYRVTGLKNSTKYNIGQLLTKTEVQAILDERQPEGVEVSVGIKGE